MLSISFNWNFLQPSFRSLLATLGPWNVLLSPKIQFGLCRADAGIVHCRRFLRAGSEEPREPGHPSTDHPVRQPFRSTDSGRRQLGPERPRFQGPHPEDTFGRHSHPGTSHTSSQQLWGSQQRREILGHLQWRRIKLGKYWPTLKFKRTSLATNWHQVRFFSVTNSIIPDLILMLSTENFERTPGLIWVVKILTL